MAQREIDCQGVSARMMELLYGEVSSDERAMLEAHLVGCASCRAELSSFQGTRASARRVLDADEPPARAHQAILRAATAAVVAKQSKPIETGAAAPQPSLWERWRARWTLPTFATVGAVAVVLLASKVFLEPDKTVELGRRVVRSTPTEEPAAPPPAAEPQPTARLEPQEPGRPSEPAEKQRKDNERPRLQPAGPDRATARSTAAPATARRGTVPAEGLDSLSGMMKGNGSAGQPRHKADVSDTLIGDDDLSASRPAAGAPEPAKREFAAPPPPRAEPARRAASPAKQAESDTEAEAVDEAAPRGGSGHLAGGAGAAPPPSRAKAKKVEMPPERPSKADNLDRGPAAASAPAPESPRGPAAAMADKSDAKAESRAESRPAAESPVARADRLFAQGQWAAAARAYRDLLRRDPSNGDAARWRQRLAASEEAVSSQAPAAAPAASPGRR